MSNSGKSGWREKAEHENKKYKETTAEKKRVKSERTPEAKS